MVRPRLHGVALAAATVLLAAAAGCGDDRGTKVVAARAMPTEQVQRYAPGEPARALLELIQGAQRNDPTAIAKRLTPQWRATPERLAEAMPQITKLTQAFGTPHVLGVDRQDGRAAIDLRWGGQRGTFVLVAGGRGWRLARILVNGRRLKIAGVTSP
jgi:hypothetical protein